MRWVVPDGASQDCIPVLRSGFPVDRLDHKIGRVNPYFLTIG